MSEKNRDEKGRFKSEAGEDNPAGVDRDKEFAQSIQERIEKDFFVHEEAAMPGIARFLATQSAQEIYEKIPDDEKMGFSDEEIVLDELSGLYGCRLRLGYVLPNGRIIKKDGECIEQTDLNKQEYEKYKEILATLEEQIEKRKKKEEEERARKEEEEQRAREREAYERLPMLKKEIRVLKHIIAKIAPDDLVEEEEEEEEEEEDNELTEEEKEIIREIIA